MTLTGEANFNIKNYHRPVGIINCWYILILEPLKSQGLFLTYFPEEVKRKSISKKGALN